MIIVRILAVLSVLSASSLTRAQNSWEFNTSLSINSGQFTDPIVLRSQNGQGIRVQGEKNQSWGTATGIHTTRIDMQDNIPVSRQNQDNWMLSGWVHIVPTTLTGRWTLQLDAYKTTNDAKETISSDVLTWVPKITWMSNGHPLKLDLSYAQSKYKNIEPIHQISASLAYGFNDAKDWIQVRSYNIDNLNPSQALGYSRTQAFDIKFTHLLGYSSAWLPASVTLGLERGQRIFTLDVDKQYIYNLPMLNQGGENIAAHWKMAQQTTLHAMLSKNKYRSDQPFNRDFVFTSLGVQISKSW